MKETAVKMGNIIKKVSNHMPECFFWHQVFLAAMVTKRTLYYRTAIQAVFFFSMGNMRHLKNFLKNKYKIYKLAFFFVTVQLNYFCIAKQYLPA